jgi:hypothetical protein
LRVAVEKSEDLVAEAGDSSGTLRERNVRRWKPLPNNDYSRLRRLSAVVTVIFGVCNSARLS